MVDSARYTLDDPPEAAYRAAAQTWDGRYGTALSHGRNWRLMALILASVLVVQAGVMIWAFQQRTDVPYVVVLDERGDVAQLKVAERGYTPNEQQIAYHLQSFVRWVRSVPLDTHVFSQNWEQAYAFLSLEAKAKMNDYARKTSPADGLGKVARDVQVKNIRMRGAKTFEITWSEDEWRDGRKVRSTDYTGSFVVEISPPTSGEGILQNPLGLYIVEFGWSPDRPLLGG